ncbi:DNA internalization-related competence protein ComEC/Rec2 [Polynucleobacter sp. MWH-Svant-W18]|uniref:DNA internalization-related competence protein ComEC/Rec2 n=1 Tax=Polynucleobacter sp. MWH-Svant-W18 TaxID=1855909 RepID=UPI001BFD123F|nr:DNA internalization-related competence protein ComEC/Rec2 [Polynucleobacter sp. MWH-Svant-W18]QWD78854.1 DNA internalization-related competence protein ComEC/Rec2 [Polynucleobacter sp. MWH-Svant-W18]
MPHVPANWAFGCSLLGGILFGFICIPRSKPLLRHMLVIALMFVFGFAWNARYAENRLNNILAVELEGKELTVEGRVVGLPQGNADGAKFAFEIEHLLFNGEYQDQFPGQVYLSWQPAWRNPEAIPEVIPGQRWKFRVKLKRPYGSLNPFTFDFERWAFHQDFGANGSIRSGELILMKDIGITEFVLRMELARWELRKKIKSLLPADARYAGVIIALVMGDQNAINQEDWQVFNATGIGHLISISGLHVTMLAGVGASIAGFIWRRRSLPLIVPVSKVAGVFGFLTAFVYAWLAGFQIPAQRTMYMVGVVAFALWSGRNPRSFDIWWWALALVLIIDPMAPYTPGFWLSFGAVAAILFAMGDSVGLLGIPTGKELQIHWTHRMIQALREASRVQAVVTIALLPFTLYWFYQVSVVSPLANAFAIPLVSYVVTPLAIAGALLPDFIGRWLLLPAHAAMEYLAIALDWMAGWSWSVVWARQPGWWVLLLSGLGIIYAIRPGDLMSSWKSRTLALCLSIPLFTPISQWWTNASLSAGEFRATVLDIGQGTAVLIETRNKKLLYDTGPIQGKKDDAGQRVILPYFRGRGIDHIDRMVISHSDSDHVGGGATLLKHIRFDSMMGSLPSNNSLLENFQARKIPSLPCRFGQHWAWDEVDFIVWHPHEETLFADQYSRKPNEMSCVLEIRNQENSLWLTGDVEKQGEAEITERLNLIRLTELGKRKIIFMAPHHGSKTSSSLELLKTLEPDYAFAQNGYRNRYGHPHATVTARYKDLNMPFYQSPITGAQIWTFNKGGPSVQFWRPSTNRLWHRKVD